MDPRLTSDQQSDQRTWSDSSTTSESSMRRVSSLRRNDSGRIHSSRCSRTHKSRLSGHQKERQERTESFKNLHRCQSGQSTILNGQSSHTRATTHRSGHTNNSRRYENVSHDMSGSRNTSQNTLTSTKTQC